ncbi:MAG: Mitochondrial translocator assembly and maintenance protein 41 [Bathelium mastoideum]|nr:MAG: Mitochondrial translocator assembly and maintenance protein 41 [Bathelium mastoideum]
MKLNAAVTSTSSSANQSMPPGWEDNPDYNISAFSQLPHQHFGFNQFIVINEEFKEALRQILWQFRAPIRYAFAYGSGVFSQDDGQQPTSLSPHPHPPEAVKAWQKGGGKMIDFIFGVSFTQHWHSLNLTQHRDHYSFLGSLGSAFLSRVQDSWGAGVYFNPYITVNGTLIKYGVANLDTISRDLSEWDTLYLAGRLQKPVKILRDDPGVRLANQVNLISAVRAALLMLGSSFTERELYTAIAGISYLGDPRMELPAENPRKVANIVSAQSLNFRQLYTPLIENLPNVTFTDPRCSNPGWVNDPDPNTKMEQDMDPVKRGNIVRRLPKALRKKLYFQYQKKFSIPASAFDQVLDESKDEDDASFKRRQGGDFEQRIAEQADLPRVMGDVIRNTIRWPSTSQSIKSFFTAGPVRSWRYVSEKAAKSRQVRTDAPSKPKEESAGNSDEKKQA